MPTKNKLKRDSFRRNRRGSSHFLLLSCTKCNQPLLEYQKDGPGALKRVYLDRIINPKTLNELANRVIKEVPNLSCKECKEILGIPYIYKKEKRKAFRLFQNSVSKKS